jgi:multidrug efflux pump
MLGVTLFGIFLTPVFYYVIQGTSESKLFQSRRIRSFVSHAVGGLLGATVGFLLARLGVGMMPWPPIVGACAGLLAVRGVRSAVLRRRGLLGSLPPAVPSRSAPPSEGEPKP